MSKPIISIDFAANHNTVTCAAANADTQLLVSPSITIPDTATMVVIIGRGAFQDTTNGEGLRLRLRRGTGLLGVIVQDDNVVFQTTVTNQLVPLVGVWFDQITTIGTVTYTLGGNCSGGNHGSVLDTQMVVLVL